MSHDRNGDTAEAVSCGHAGYVITLYAHNFAGAANACQGAGNEHGCQQVFLIVAMENLADTIKTFMLSVSTNPTVVVLIIIGIMLVIGCFMETLAATAVILPIVYPLVMSLGVDPLMFGVLFSIATVVGALTPPVGLYLFLSMSIAEAPFKEAIRYTVPVVLIILAVMVLMLIWPPLVTFVPHLLMGT